MFVKFLFLCITALPFMQCHIYEEIPQEYFNDLSEIESVVVPLENVPRRNKRSTVEQRELHFNAFGEKFALYFEPVDHVLMGSKTKIIKAATNDYGVVNYEEDTMTMKNIKLKTYVDKRSQASAVEFITPGNSSRALEGVINGRYQFKLLESYKFEKVQVSRIPDHKDSPKLFGKNSDLFGTVEKDNKTASRNRVTSTKKLPDIIYPEILVVADYSFYTFFKGNILDMVKYLAGFWTSVDLRYREMSEPKIRLNIPAIIIATDFRSTPYIKTNAVGVLSDPTIAALAHMENNARIPKFSFDIVMIMTRKPLLAEDDKTSILGISILEGVCETAPSSVRISRSNVQLMSIKTQSVGITRDSGYYVGAVTAAHELGHIFGARHDESESKLQKKTCGTFEYIMGTTPSKEHQSGQLYFSECSKTAFRTLFKNHQMECMYNKPDVGTPIIKPLIGLTVSQNEQCKILFGKTSRHVSTKETACKKLYCIYKLGKNEYIKASDEAPAEGSYCEEGTDKICLNGKCDYPPESALSAHALSNNYKIKE